MRLYTSLALAIALGLSGCEKGGSNSATTKPTLEQKVDSPKDQRDSIREILETTVNAVNGRDYGTFRAVHIGSEKEVRVGFDESVKELTKRGVGSKFTLGEVSYTNENDAVDVRYTLVVEERGNIITIPQHGKMSRENGVLKLSY